MKSITSKNLIVLSGVILESDLKSIEDFKKHTEVLAFLSSPTFQKNIISDTEEKLLEKAISSLTNKLNQYALANTYDSFKLEKEPIDALSYLIKYNEVNEDDLISALDISYGHYRNIIKGQRSISRTVARKLCDYFKVDPNVFIKKI